jgi:hypothetical protein
MIDILDTARQTPAVYWPPAGRDAANRVTYGDPVQVPGGVYWVEIAEAFTGPGGQQLVSKAKVLGDSAYTNGLDWVVDGVLWQGEMEDVPNAALHAPLKLPGAQIIRQTLKTPTLDYDQYCRVAYL